MTQILATAILAALAASGLAGDVTIAWDYPYTNHSAVGFAAHWGASSRRYTSVKQIADPAARQITISGLATTETVYVALTAYNRYDVHSEYSAELAWDNEPPVLTWLSDTLTYDIPAGAPLVMPDLRGLVTVTDDISRPDAITLSQEPVPGALLTVGATHVTILAADEVGNTAQTEKTLTVTMHVEIAPVGVTGVDSRGRQLQPVQQEAVHE